MNFDELTQEQKLAVSKESTYTIESLEEENPYFVPAENMDEYIMDLFYECNNVPEHIAPYIDEDRVIRDFMYDYCTVELDGEIYCFRSF